jgi:hypothetical protein
MLPEDAQARRLAAVAENVKQGTLDDHVRELAPTERVVPYSDKLFREAAVEWLISTNQVFFLIVLAVLTHYLA